MPKQYWLMKSEPSECSIDDLAGAVLRLVGAVLIEAHDEWQVAERRYLSEGSMAKLTQTSDDAARPKEVRRATAELVTT